MATSQSRLKKITSKLKFGKEKSLPMSQGWAINEVIKKYKIPAIKWGYYSDMIGVETKKQKIFWKDKGGYLEFLGIINK